MSSPNWLITGNDGTNQNVDFFGTTDNQPLSIRTNGLERVRVDTGGNVGIGTNQPLAPLHVVGRISTGRPLFEPGTITFLPSDAAGSFHIDNGPAGGQRPIGRLRISSGNSPGDNEIISVLQNGLVGIGTVAPTSKLHVEGGDMFVNGEGNGVIVDAAGLKRIGLMKYPNKEAILIGSSQLPSPIRLGRWEGGTITAPSQVHEDLVINSQGSIGIGTPTPASKLHVSAGMSPNPTQALTVEAIFETDEAARASYLVLAQERLAAHFVLNPQGQNVLIREELRTHFVVRGDGNVGIGTSQPTETLHVNGNIRVDVGNVAIGTDTSEFILDVNERIRLRGEGGNTAGLWLFQTSKNQAFVGMANDSHVGLFGNNGANWGLVMDTANGNVGIGGTGRSPVSKLHVDVAASPNPIGALSVDVESFVTAPNAQASYFLRVRDIGASALPPHFLIRGDGNVGIGDASPSTRLSVKGDVTVSGDVFLAGADCAEHFDLCGAQSLEPGTVVIIDQDGAVCESREAYDKKVAGVVSGAGEFKHAIVLDRRPSEGPRVPVALLGKVYCKVDARCSPIGVGDFLTTSPTPGHAMKALDPTQAMGSVIGKALRPLEGGEGVIPILIALQ
jgi:hypothetical protein